MAIAWSTYISDNHGLMPESETGNSVTAGYGNHPWVRDAGLGRTDNIQANRSRRLSALQQGLLFEYLQSIDIYRCPSESRAQVLRTYSISGWLNGDPFHDGNLGSAFRTLVKREEVLSPAISMSFIEEFDERGDNLGSWIMTASETRDGMSAGWADWPGNFHNGGNGHAFVDGHARYRRFASPQTGQISIRGSFPPLGDPDARYYDSIFNPGQEPIDRGRRSGGRRN